MLLWTLVRNFRISDFVFSRYIARGEILGSYDSSIFSFFWGTSIISSIVAAPIYIFTNGVLGFPFLNTLLPFIICGLFSHGHSDRYEVISHCGFDLCFSDDLVMLKIFLCTYWPSVCLLWKKKNVSSGLLPIS